MFTAVEEAIKEIREGRIIVVVDDEDRESEGDLICAASLCTAEHVNFMAKFGRGLICTALSSERVEELHLPPMSSNNESLFSTAFTVSVEAREGITTGISAQDRAITSRRLADSNFGPRDFVTPGHTFPLKARKGGVLFRAGHTEAAVDLAILAGLPPAGVICEVMAEDGTMMRLAELKVFAELHGLKIITTNDLIAYRSAHEVLVKEVAHPQLPSKYGEFTSYAYEDVLSGIIHIAMVNGEIQPDQTTNVRVHSECLTGDTFGSQRCDCGEQLEAAMRFIGEHGGVFLYMRGHEGRGIGLVNKLKAYELQEGGLDTVEANHKLGFKTDHRTYGIGAQILRDLGVGKIKLLTNNPQKIVGLKGYGLEVVERMPVEVPSNNANKKYMQTKKEKMGHHFTQF
jgi:3,4-dihydroxy 2-butanone 4-phosphate synthase / GTP cyclohydrolase II